MDENYQKGKASTEETKDLIFKDLQVAAKNKYWKSVIGAKKLKDGSTTLSDWLKLNGIGSRTLSPAGTPKKGKQINLIFLFFLSL